MRKIILASGSSRRKEMLAKAGFEFETVQSPYDEDMSLFSDPVKLVIELAYKKAEAVARDQRDALVIGSDCIVVLDNEALGKPHTPEKASEMLKRLSGRMNSVLTSYVILDCLSGAVVKKVCETKVYFKELSNKEIEDYVATGEPLDRAGAYAIQGGGRNFVEKYEGLFSTVMGFPIEEVEKDLKKFL